MSSIDLAILGMVLEKPQSAYDVQKDIEYHHFSRWTKISTPSIYKNMLRLCDKGYLQSKRIKGNKLSEKAVYSVTEEGKKYFAELMTEYASKPVPILFDFNVVITNLNKLDEKEADILLNSLRDNIMSSLLQTESYAEQYSDIPLAGRAIFHQQIGVYKSLLEWLDSFKKALR